MAIGSTSLPPSSTSNSGETAQGTMIGRKPVQSTVNQQIPESLSNAVPRGDSVTLTQSALNLNMLQADIKLPPEIDTERVNSLKSALESGQYDFNPTRVAEKFLQFELQL